jgi:hypothetical protein
MLETRESAEEIMKPVKYKVWVHIEGLNKEGDCIEGDGYFEPREAGEFEREYDAVRLRDAILALSDVLNDVMNHQPEGN